VRAVSFGRLPVAGEGPLVITRNGKNEHNSERPQQRKTAEPSVEADRAGRLCFLVG
jgi:hypothetical protein